MIFSDIFINYLIEGTNRSLMYKSNGQRRRISLPEGKTLEDDLMFDIFDCFAILLTALANSWESRMYAVFSKKRRSVFDHVPDPGAKL